MEPSGNIEAANPSLNAVFSALADPTRRRILDRLRHGEASVSEIAEPFEMSQPAISKHLKVLETAGLIERTAAKQRRPARLRAEPMQAAMRWLSDFEEFWAGSLDQLNELLTELQSKPRTDAAPKDAGERNAAARNEGEAE